MNSFFKRWKNKNIEEKIDFLFILFKYGMIIVVFRAILDIAYYIGTAFAYGLL